MTGRASPVLLDFESRSRAKLKDVGGRRYWEHPSTEALCCVAHDTRDHTWHLWLPGDPTPEWARGNRVLAAHNMAMFDRFGCHKYGWRAYHWLDTSHLARRAGLPGGLDQLGKRWLGRDKDATGHTLTLALSRVSTARKRAGQWQTEVTPEVLARVVAYCEADVAILVDAWPRLARWLDIDEGARRMNAIINDRGVGFDSQLAKRLIEESDRLADDAIATAAAAWGESTEATRKLVMHPPSLAELLGIPDATRPTLLDARTREWGDDRERVGALIDARLAASSIAKGKLLAGLAHVCPDGRMRDSLRYYGGHTGRESSIGMQLHNLPRPHGDFDDWTADQIEDLAERVLAGQHATDREVGLLIRACLVADGEFAVCDFSGVEARALAWMSGDRAAVRVFEAGRDVYKVFASTIFGVPYDQIDKTQRGAGKIGELACLGADTEVLTRRGWRAITSVQSWEQVWDGIEWVNHAGLVPRGLRETIELDGLRVTPDHLFLCETGWRPSAALARDASTRRSALAIGSASLPSRGSYVARLAGCARSWLRARAAPPSIEHTSRASGAAVLPGVTGARSGSQAIRSSATGATPTCAPTTSTAGGYSTGSPRFSIGATTLTIARFLTTAAAELQCTLAGAVIALLFWLTCSRYRAGTTRRWTSTARTTLAGMSRAICDSLRGASIWRTAEPSRSYSPGSPTLRPVYDLAHAGPRNRFMVRTRSGTMLAHNCGYQMGWRKLERDKGEQLARAGSSAKAVVAAWRDLHSPSVALWYELEDAWQAAAMGETPPPVGDGMLADAGIGIQCLPGEGEDEGSVAIVLPSGRPLIYPDACVELGRKGRREGSYLGSAKSMREHVYGGMLAENVDQAICRDELMRALEASEGAGLNPVLDVHDEIVCDVPRGSGAEALDELHAIMVAKSEWMTGMPLAAEGFVSRRYRK